MKASDQGDIEATDLLKMLIKSGRGITEHNYMDVKRCINMSQDEKLARKAARDMFSRLSNGEDYIMSQQLEKRMLEIDKRYQHGEPSNGIVDSSDGLGSDPEVEFNWAQRLELTNEKLTEENIVTAAVDYSRGHLPDVTNILCLHEPNLHALDNVPAIHRPVLHPILVFQILYYKLIKLLGASSWLNPFSILRSNFQLPLLVLIYMIANSQSALHFFPMLVFYSTFLVMVVSTFQMLQQSRDFIDFRMWSGLFLTYSGGSLRPDQAEYQYIKNNLKPFGHFFLALLINLVIYPLISDQWIPQSELTVVAFFLTFMTLHGFAPKEHPDFTILFSFAINVLAKYPYETDPVVTQGWRFLDVKIPTFVTYIIGNGIEFCINCRIVFYILIPLLFVRIGSRNVWKGVYKCLIPHCVTLSWLQIVIINSQGATVFGLLRGTLALVGVVFFLPLSGLATILLPAAALTKWLFTSTSLYSMAVFASFTSISLGIAWVLAKSRFKSYTATLQVILTVITLTWLLNSTATNTALMHDHGSIESITWDQYQSICHEPSWERSSMAVTQFRCSRLAGTRVEWMGYVNYVKIKSVTNFFKPLFNMLPIVIQNHLCSYDTDYNEPLKLYGYRSCAADVWNSYEFEISIRIQSGLWDNGVEIFLVADNSFTNFSLALKPTDHVRFSGTLINLENGVLGGPKPRLTIHDIECVSCLNSKLTGVKVESVKHFEFNRIASLLTSGFKCVMNFLLNPLIIFK